MNTGDIILTSKDTLFARGISFFENDESIWGHSAIVADKNHIFDTSMSGIKKVTNDKFFNNKYHKYYKIVRNKNITDKNKAIIVKSIESIMNKKYSWKRIILILLDYIFNTAKFTNLDQNKFHQVCSSFVGWVSYVTWKIKFNGKNWWSCTPDDIDDEIQKKPELWLTVKESL